MKASSQLHLRPERPQSTVGAAALRQIDAALENIRRHEERLRSSEGRERQVWAHLVRYLNADLSADVKAYTAFLEILYVLTPAPEFTEFRLAEFGKNDDFFYLSELSGARKDDLVLLAVHYQKPLQQVFLWLCSPRSAAQAATSHSKSGRRKIRRTPTRSGNARCRAKSKPACGSGVFFELPRMTTFCSLSTNNFPQHLSSKICLPKNAWNFPECARKRRICQRCLLVTSSGASAKPQMNPRFETRG
jgi:hypothetical protein